MCEYQRIRDGELPQCVVNNGVCTFCVLGNMKTFNEAKKNEEQKGGRKK